MPVKAPQGGQKNYVVKPQQTYGEQYLEGGPLPIGAVDAIEPVFPAAGGPYVNTETGVYPLLDTDWVLTNKLTGQPTRAVTHEEFEELFGPQPGGEVEE